MLLKARLRLIHRKISPWILPLLLLSAITGLIYRVGRAWFGMSKETGGKVLHLHAGEWLGQDGSVIYLTILGGTLLFLIISGLWMLLSSPRPSASPRRFHRTLAVVFTLPLIVTAITGVAFQAGKYWFHASEGTLKLLLSLHQGTWLGPNLRAYYIVVVSLGLIALCLSGLRLIWPKR